MTFHCLNAISYDVYMLGFISLVKIFHQSAWCTARHVAASYGSSRVPGLILRLGYCLHGVPLVLRFHFTSQKHAGRGTGDTELPLDVNVCVVPDDR